jgi:hypothetical protein
MSKDSFAPAVVSNPLPGFVTGDRSVINFVQGTGIILGLTEDTAGDVTLTVTGPQVFDVRAYGAVAGNDVDQAPAIQAAISAAVAARGGIILFPPGEFRIKSSIIIPKSTAAEAYPLILRGAGAVSTQLHTNSGNLASNVPLFEAQFLTNGGTRWLVIEDMQISRSDTGKVFRWLPSTPDYNVERLTASFRNLRFKSAAGGSEDLVTIDGSYCSKFINCELEGGNVGWWHSNSSHDVFISPHFPAQQNITVSQGMRITGGGNHKIIGFRGEDVSSATGEVIRLDSNTTNVELDGVWFEGGAALRWINVEAARQVTIRNAALPTPVTSGASGIRIGPTSVDTRIIGGSGADHNALVGGATIRIEDGAYGVTVDGFRIAANAISNIQVSDPIASGVQMRLLQGNPASAEFFLSGRRQIPAQAKALTDAATITVDAASSDFFTVTLGGNRTMGAPSNPTKWQRIMFKILQDGTGGRTLAWNAAFKHAWSDTGNTLNKFSTISFVYDGTNWAQDGAQSPYI